MILFSPAPGIPAPPMVPTMDEITSSSAVVRWNPIPARPVATIAIDIIDYVNGIGNCSREL